MDSAKYPARERILRTAYELFSHRGIRDVSVDEIVGSSGVAIATFYRHFPSKDALVTAFLERREEVWTTDQVVASAKAHSADPIEQLLAVFDIFDRWFNHPEFEGDSFVNVLIEMGPAHPLGQASIQHLENVRRSIQGMAEEAELENAEEFAHSFHILMKGSIITADMGDKKSAVRAKAMARRLIEAHAPT